MHIMLIYLQEENHVHDNASVDWRQRVDDIYQLVYIFWTTNAPVIVLRSDQWLSQVTKPVFQERRRNIRVRNACNIVVAVFDTHALVWEAAD